MEQYLLTSFFFHAAIALALVYTTPVNTSGGETIEVNIQSRPKFKLQAPILPTPRKYAKHGEGVGAKGKSQKIDLSNYANQVKAVVDPVWVSKVEPLHLPQNVFLLTEVLLFPDKYGSIVSVKITKSSGSRDFDRLAIQALNEVKRIPKPPESLIKEGIIWEFSTGERK